MTDQEIAHVVVPILQGLLASGHYTKQDEGNPQSMRTDCGIDWAEFAVRRHTSDAIGEALDLAGELIQTIQKNVEET